jgi:hypothetical protein
MMKKFSYVLLGGIISVALYFFVVFVLVAPIQRATGHSAESFLGLAFLIVMPVSLIVGSAVTGYLIQPIIGERSLQKYIYINPGVYLGLLTIFFNFRQLFAEFFLLSVVWGFISAPGLRLGLRLRDKRDNQSE